jgi:hypothetical protein
MNEQHDERPPGNKPGESNFPRSWAGITELAGLNAELLRTGGRIRRLRLQQTLTTLWLRGAVLAMCVWVIGLMAHWPGLLSGLIVAGLVLLAAGCAYLASRHFERNPVWVARKIENAFPELESRLLTALEQRRDAETGEFGYLQLQVIQEAYAHCRAHAWPAIVAPRQLWLAAGTQTAALGLFGLALLGLVEFGTAPEGPELLAQKPPAAASTAKELCWIAVEPGDVSVERGTDLAVLARFEGRLPPTTVLVTLDGSQPTRVEMTKSLNDPLYFGNISAIKGDLTYWIEYGEQRTAPFQISVFDYPAVERIDAEVAFPSYTGLAAAAIPDTRRVSAVEGSSLTLRLQLNKPVAAARLIAEGAPPVLLTADSGEQSVMTGVLTLKESCRYRIELVDAEQRTNRQPEEFAVDALPNRPPELKLTAPGRDVQVSPLEELLLKATVWDDFGLQAYGIEYTLAGRDPHTIVLGKTPAASEAVQAAHLLALEELAAEADQLVAYHFWADDIGPDGKVRRTQSDLFFAEVRPFEEIFRQGEQPPGGGGQAGAGGQQGDQAEQLGNLQKEVLNATWKLQRRQAAAAAPIDVATDGAVIQQAEKTVLEQAAALETKSKTAESKALLQAALVPMRQALALLTEAASQNSATPLPAALAAEQAAYQALLKLRAHEHRVTQGQPGGGGGGGGGSSSQQLQQLELSNAENRYETERRAGAQNGRDRAEQREQNQVLSRLRELARRQADVNQKLQELQIALQAAKSDQEQAEARRQLQRLREEQQDLLQNLDELKNRMEQARNQSSMVDARKQLGQTRSEVAQASEALRQGQVPQALTAGARAEQKLQQIGDDLRKKSSGEFAEAMQGLRQEARQLAGEQQKLAQGLDSLQKSERRSLRDSADRQKIQTGLEGQKQKLNEIVDEMRQVTQAAESSEPLLSKQLYDTLRRTSQDQLAQKLQTTADLVQRGLAADASTAEQGARQGIEKLKQGVEKAANSVLGDETAALRRARQELQDAAERVQRELAQANPESAPGGAAAGDEEGAPGKPERTGASSRGAGGKPPVSREQNERAAAEDDENSNASAQRPASEADPSPGSGTESQNPAREPGGARPGNGSSPKNQPGAKSSQGSPAGSSESGSPGKAASDAGGQGGAPSEGQSPGSSPDKGATPGTPGTPGLRGSGGPRPQALAQGGLGGGSGGPMLGGGFREWSDQLRDIEEMLEDPQLRGEVARIRDRAQELRSEFQRHAREPDWERVQKLVAEPLVELQVRLAEELAKRESPDALVPLDRDPVPRKFSDLVRRYYERLGSGK